MNVYRILPNRYFGGVEQIPDFGILPPRTTTVQPSQNILNGTVYGVYGRGAWTETATPPPSPGVALPSVVLRYSISLKDFWRRFTVAEREALQNILATGTQNQKNKLNAFRDYLLQGGDVELNDDYVIASVTTMESANVIGNGRAAQILAPTPE